MNATVRPANFAGRFYPEKLKEVEKVINMYLSAELDKIKLKLASNKIIGGVVPHAGWVYSGYEAIHFYELLKLSAQHFDTVVVVNPNHTGFGKGSFNIDDWEFWDTPLGKIQVDKDFAFLLDIVPDNAAHFNEHSGEVQLPFLKYSLPNPFKLVMITMNAQTVENAKILADKIHHAVEIIGKSVLVVASSDFSHYEKPNEGKVKDQLVIDQILKRDTQSVEHVVKRNQVSVCGYGPIMTLLEFAKLQSSNFEIELLRKGNSGEVKPSDKVVGYASMLCFEPK